MVRVRHNFIFKLFLPRFAIIHSLMHVHPLENKVRSQGFQCIAGFDEAGRGPLAGPVVAACIVLPADFRSEMLDDSKKITRKTREILFENLTKANLPHGIGISSVEEIDKLNIFQASMLAMKKAFDQMVKQFGVTPDMGFIDGHLKSPYLTIPQMPVVKGDSKIMCIAAASILAKVTRDHMMLALAEKYPQYGFEKHMGYGTANHEAMVKKHGRCPEHRNSFKFGFEKVLA